MLLDLLVVGLDLILSGNKLGDVAVPELDGELGIRGHFSADADPEEVGDDGDDTVPVDDQNEVHQVERLGNSEVVQGHRLVGLDLIEDTSDGRGDGEVEGSAELRNDFDNLEGGGNEECGEDDCNSTKNRKIKRISTKTQQG